MLTPILALDIDGVLNRLARVEPGEAGTWEARTIDLLVKDIPKSPFHRQHDEDILGYPVTVNPVLHTAWFKAWQERGIELVWATTWENQANICFAPFYNLEPLPVACSVETTLPRMSQDTPDWKATALEAYAGERPLIWLDDMNWAYASLSKTSEEENRERQKAFDDPASTGFKPEGGPWLELFWGYQYQHVALQVDPRVGASEQVMEETDTLFTSWGY